MADRFDAHEDMLRRLIMIAAQQDTINDDLRAFVRQQGAINDRLTAAIERIDRTLAQGEVTQQRILALLDRMLHPGGNGREV